MILFNLSVVTPLISDIKGEPVSITTESAPEPETKPESADEAAEEDEEMRLLKDLKENPQKAARARSSLPIQKEITLKDDVPYLERADLFEAYLHYCITGDVQKMPFGFDIQTKVNDREYERLDQLGDILGLTADEKRLIRINIAEKSFIKEAEVILADGQLSKSKIELLTKLQNDVKLPEEHAQKVIKNITRNKMAASIEAAVNNGRMGLAEVRELKEAKVDINDVMSEKLRETIFKKAAEEVFSNGKGEFDETVMYDKVTEDLSIDKEKATKVVQEIAKARLGSTLIQAVAQLRQKNQDGVVASLNDMLACDMAAPVDGPLSWSSPGELDDLYCLYLKSIPKPEKLSRLQKLLGISDEKAFSLQDAAREGALPITTAEEEEEFAF